ncbi:MAG: DNA primase [Candidatus Levybacteria bacterium]|nr:DNA primase [Candidatus Levybacteria bacterium]
MDDVERVREKVDIVSLISEYLPLKKTGSHFKALCPFHSEKTPSFIVSPERQIWRCFGCSVGGDCFSFLMQYEHIEFPEALRMLAKRAGVTLAEGKMQTEISSKKEKFYKLNKLALDFYHYILMQHNAGRRALSYLFKTRSIKEQVAKTFKLGFAPGIGNALTQYLIKKKNIEPLLLVEAGLSMQRSGQTLDFFQNRIIFPLHDHRGNVIGFSGRVFDEKDTVVSKYVNTKETMVYHKGDVFFGLHLAKDAIKKAGNALIMEGEFDVLSSFQEGITNAIAIKGTAFTEFQANLLSRFTSTVILCLDEDKAGYEALKRSLPVLEKKGLTIKAVKTTDTKDPDEAVRKDSAEFKKAVSHAVSVYDYLLEKTLSDFDYKTVDGKKAISDTLLPILSDIENEIIKEHYFRLLARSLETSYENILKQADKLKSKQDILETVALIKKKRPREQVLEEYFLALLFQHVKEKSLFEQYSSKFGDIVFSIPSHKKLFEHLVTYFGQDDAFDSGKFTSFLPSELLTTFDTCLLFPLPSLLTSELFEREMRMVVRELSLLSIRTQIKVLGEKIKEAEATHGEEVLEKLKEQHAQLVSRMATYN